MVRAILEDRKTMTRRVVKLPSWSTGDWGDFEYGSDELPEIICKKTGCLATIPCPYGNPGEQLYVKESFVTASQLNADGHINARYLADDHCFEIDGSEYTMGRIRLGVTRTGRFAPKWASRITLEIVSVRVERLQDISDDDAWAEGYSAYEKSLSPRQWDTHMSDAARIARRMRPDAASTFPAAHFAALWNAINSKREGCSWEANPYVWVVEFKVLEPSASAA